MKFFFTKGGFIILLSIAFFTASAQQSFFSDIAEAAAKKADQKRLIVPVKFRTVQLDTSRLLPFFRSLPSEQTIINNHSGTPVLSLPMPDGTTARFHVWESSAMAPELAAAYPELKTFTGQGIDDRTATIKLDWTEFGFHAMILSPSTGEILIDPYDQKTVINYISYYKADYKKKEKFTELPPVNFQKNAAGRPADILAGVCVGTQLRTYRLAIACTGEYAEAATDIHPPSYPTKAQVLAKIVTTVNRVNGIYETEVSIRLVLTANDTKIIFTNADTDPFTGNDNGDVLINESQTVIDDSITNAGYDIGHTFSTGAGGLAGPGVVCVTGEKSQGVTGSPLPVGDAYDVDYVAHEMGHQFGGSHTFNSLSNFCGSIGQGSITTNAEPGSGVTIMAYAGICAPDDLADHSIPYFHAISFDEITQYSINDAGNGCAVKTNTGNTPPVVNAGADYTIPTSTPFALTGSATDADGDALSYSWEETDIGGPFGSWDAPSGNAPLFRSFKPVATPVRYFPKLFNQVTHTDTIGELLPSYARALHFRLTARDNRAGGGGVCYDQTVITVANTGPFTVTYPTASGVVWNVNEFQNVTWDPAGTAMAPVSCTSVTIQLSTDGGYTYPVTLVAGTPNDGSQEIQVPNNVSSTCRIRVIAVGNVFYDLSNSNFRIQTPSIASFSLNRPEPVAACSGTSGTGTLKTAPLAGFTTAISLSASLNPAGTTVSFGSNPVMPGSNTSVTLNNTNTLAAGSYTVRVTATAGSITKTRDIIFLVGTGAAAPSSLTQPANDAIGQSQLTTFTWAAVAGATSYTLEISAASDFTTMVQTITDIAAATITLTTPLTENTVYYWRIRATNSCGSGQPSDGSRFKTGISTCRASLDVPKTISAFNMPTVNSTLTIPASSGVVINDLNIVNVTGDHTYFGDLTFTLISPNGTTSVVLNTVCDFSQTFDFGLDDQSSNGALDCPPSSGQSAVPANPLAAFNGQNSDGIWTLRIKDNASGDGGHLTGWGLNINSGSNNSCTYISTPLATVYEFTGSGNWDIPSNWSGNVVPPSTLPANNSIVINHADGGNCTLNVTQHISSGAALTVMTGKNLIVPGSLTVQ